MHECVNCHKIFTRKINLQYHIEHNVCSKKSNKVKITIKNNNTEKLQLPLTYENMSKQELRVKILHLEGENRALKENPQIVNNNTNNQITILVPPAFLTVDNYQQLTKQLPDILHTALVKHPANFISFLIKETNCNPDLPMYNSIKLTNKKDQIVQVSDGHKYIYAPKKSVIAQLIENKREILQKYVDNNGDKYGEKILKKYQNYIDFLDDDKDAQKDLEIDIICMLLNVSNIIGSDDWSINLLENLKHIENKD